MQTNTTPNLNPLDTNENRKIIGNIPLNEIPFPNVSKHPISWGRRNTIMMEDYCAIVNDDTFRDFAVASDSYNLVDYKETLQVAEQAITALEEWGPFERTIMFLDGGAKMRVKYRFPETEININGDKKSDLINPTFELFTSYDLGWALRTILGAFRLVCSNGMVVGKTLASYKHKHTIGLDLDRMKSITVKGLEDYSNQTQLWSSLMDRSALPREVTAMDTIGFHKGEREELMAEAYRTAITHETIKQGDDEIEIPLPNAWELYNMYTHASTHKVEDEVRKSKIEENIASTFSDMSLVSH